MVDIGVIYIGEVGLWGKAKRNECVKNYGGE